MDVCPNEIAKAPERSHHRREVLISRSVRSYIYIKKGDLVLWPVSESIHSYMGSQLFYPGQISHRIIKND